LNNLKKIQSEGWDGVIVVDGKERSGKSILGMNCGWYLSNGTMTERNFAKGLDDCARKISELPDNSILQVDEGSIMFSSKDSTSNSQKKLMQILDVVGQKNIIFIICLPCFFDLNKTIAVRRSLFLLHVYPNEKYKRGQYAYWGEKTKKPLYMFGKRHFDSYAFPDAEFIGEFCNFKPGFYEHYLEIIKKESLKEVLTAAMDSKRVKMSPMEIEKTALKNIIPNLMIEFPEISNKKISRVLGKPNTTIADWIKEQKYTKIAQ